MMERRRGGKKKERQKKNFMTVDKKLPWLK